jgi:phosphate transport system permease protein
VGVKSPEGKVAIRLNAVKHGSSQNRFFSSGPQSAYSALPIQIYSWVSQPQPAFQVNAAAGIVLLMLVLLLTNSVAIYLRNRYQRRVGVGKLY